MMHDYEDTIRRCIISAIFHNGEENNKCMYDETKENTNI